MQAQDIILRVRHPKGFNRLTVNSKDTVKVLKEKIAALAQIPVTDFKIYFDGSYSVSTQLISPDTNNLSTIPKLKNGVELFLKTQPQMATPQLEKKRSLSPQLKAQSQQNVLSVNCNHSLNQRCINCIPQTNPKDKDPKANTVVVNKCTHPPGGSCLNCIDTGKKDDKSEKSEQQKWLCQHGPSGKCSHCVDADYISNIKHVSFTHFLDEKKLKCKGVHPPTALCPNCTPPSEVKQDLIITFIHKIQKKESMNNFQYISSSDFIIAQNIIHINNYEYQELKNKCVKQNQIGIQQQQS